MSSQGQKLYRRPTVEDTVVSEAGFNLGRPRAASARPSHRRASVLASDSRHQHHHQQQQQQQQQCQSGPKSPSDSGYSSNSHPSLGDSANTSPQWYYESLNIEEPVYSGQLTAAEEINALVVRRASKTRSDSGGARARRIMPADQDVYAPSSKNRPRLPPMDIPRSSPNTTPTAIAPPTPSLGPYPPSQYPPPTFRYHQVSAPPTPLGYPGYQTPQTLPPRSASIGNYFPQQQTSSVPRSSPISPFTRVPSVSQQQQQPPSYNTPIPRQQMPHRPRPMTWHTEPPQMHWQNGAMPVMGPPPLPQPQQQQQIQQSQQQPQSSLPRRSLSTRSHSHSSAAARKIRPMQMQRGESSKCLPKEGKHLHKPNKRYSETKGRDVPMNCCRSCCSSEDESSEGSAVEFEEPRQKQKQRQPKLSKTQSATDEDDDRYLRGDIKIITRSGEEKTKKVIIDRHMLKQVIKQPTDKSGKRRAITIEKDIVDEENEDEEATASDSADDQARIALQYQERVTKAAQRRETGSSTPAYMADTVGETSKSKASAASSSYTKSRRNSYTDPPVSPTRSHRSDYSRESGMSAGGRGFTIRSFGELNVEDDDGRMYTIPAREGIYAEMRVNNGRQDKSYHKSDVSRSSRRTRGSRSSPPLDTIVESSTRRRPTTSPNGT